MQKVSWCVAATMLSVDQQFRLRYSQLAVAGSVSEIDFIISFFLLRSNYATLATSPTNDG